MRNNLSLAPAGQPEDFRNDFENAIPTNIDVPRLFRVIVMPLKTPSKTAGGILLAESTQQGNSWNQQLGRVVELGPFVGRNRNYRDIGYDPDKDNLKIGDLCMFSAHNPERITFKGVNMLVIMDDAIMIGPIKPENVQHYKFGRYDQIDMGGIF